MPRGEGLVGEDVGLGLVHQLAELGELLVQAVGDPAPLPLRGLRGLLGEGGAEQGRDQLPAALRRPGLHLALEVHPAALPGGREHAGDRCLDPLVRVGDTSSTPRSPRRTRPRRNSVQNGAASEGPTSSPSTSRRPRSLTPMAMIAATVTTRPSRCTLR